MRPFRAAILPFLLLTAVSPARANGVLVADASRPVCARVLGSEVEVTIENQVAITTTTQIFKNTSSSDLIVKYAFPLPEGASATKLRWKSGDMWYTANFSAQAQDTFLPGGAIAYNLNQYLGKKPLYFGIEGPLKADSLMSVELTYVQLLLYRNGVVSYTYPNDYRLVQTFPLEDQSLSVALSSQRTIESVQLVSHQGGIVNNDGSRATVSFSKDSSLADAN